MGREWSEAFILVQNWALWIISSSQHRGAIRYWAGVAIGEALALLVPLGLGGTLTVTSTEHRVEGQEVRV